MLRCSLCLAVIWGRPVAARIKDRKDPVKLCPECCGLLDLMGRIEEYVEERDDD